MRGENDRWEKITIERRPIEGKRKKGLPRTRWRNKLEGRVDSLWHREVNDRLKWRRMGEADAQFWAVKGASG